MEAAARKLAQLTLLRHFLNDLAQCLYTRDVW